MFLHIPTPPLQDLLKPALLLCSQQQCLVGQLVLLGHLKYSVGAGKLLEVQEQVEIVMCSALSSLTPQCSEPNYSTMLILFFLVLLGQYIGTPELTKIGWLDQIGTLHAKHMAAILIITLKTPLQPTRSDI